MWAVYAVGSAIFAALTSILAKIGINGVNSTLATAIRTVVVALMSWAMGLPDRYAERRHGDQPQELAVPDPLRTGYGRLVAVLLQSAAAGRGLKGRSHRQDERHHHADSCLCVPARAVHGQVPHRRLLITAGTLVMVL